MTDVKVLARWDGWCDPCEVERPLVLTETGPRGLRAWLHGLGHEDRALTLTCAVCGEWQSVPHDEDDLRDLPDRIDLDSPSPLLALQPLGVHQVVVSAALQEAPDAPVYPTARAVPARQTQPMTVRLDSSDAALELLAEGLDLITVSGR